MIINVCFHSLLMCVCVCVCVCVNEIKQLRKSEQLIDNFNNVLYKFMSIKTIGKANKKKESTGTVFS